MRVNILSVEANVTKVDLLDLVDDLIIKIIEIVVGILLIGT